MANGCVRQQTGFSVAGDRPVVCPKPRRLLPVAVVRPFRWNAAVPTEASDPRSGDELLDILLPKPSDQTLPFFCGSPPTRSDNPVVNDARFGEAVPLEPVPVGPALIGSGSGSAAGRIGCARIRYGLTPAAVRVEGFDCLDRERSRSRGIAAIA